jgi:hypothetical protein
MLHVGARYYDPTIGRFLQRDPIGISGGLNVYAYANNCPNRTVDVTGHYPSALDVVTAMGIVFGATYYLADYGFSPHDPFGAAILATVFAGLDGFVVVPATTWTLTEIVCKMLVPKNIGSTFLSGYYGGATYALAFGVGMYVGYLEAALVSMSLGLW